MLHGTWDLPEPGIEPMSPALAGGFLTTVLPGTSLFKILNEKNLKPRILYPASLSFKIGGEIENFSDKQKLKEYSNTKPVLKDVLKGYL